METTSFTVVAPDENDDVVHPERRESVTIDELLPEPEQECDELLPEPEQQCEIPVQTETDTACDTERESWDRKMEFILSVVGFTVGLGNVWRFPYMCYKNGGGAFLIPYVVMLVFGGFPLFYMELALGQFQRVGCISVWDRICPMFKGLGFAICVISVLVAIYYNTLIAWFMLFLVASCGHEVPWATCGNPWNSQYCISADAKWGNGSANYSALTNGPRVISSAQEYFEQAVQESPHLSPDLVLGLLIVFVIVYVSLWKGIKSSGKAVWVTATLPYLVLGVLLIRGTMLKGSFQGISYYLTPQWHMLLRPGVWIDAAAQVFFSLGPGFGVLVAFASYNKFHNNCYKDAMVTATINCLTSFLAGFVVFSVLGYMAVKQDTTVENVAKHGGAELVFVVYPEAIATLAGSPVWAVLVFLMLITLGIDSTFGSLEAMITGICDEWPMFRKRRKRFVLILVCALFLCAISTTAYAGNYVVGLLDAHGAPVAILCICFLEAIAVNWFYGVNRFADDVESMLGFRPGIFWIVCWAFISPAILLISFIMSIVWYEPLVVGSYAYPPWATAVSWLIPCSALICIPAYVVYKAIVTRCRGMIKPAERPTYPE